MFKTFTRQKTERRTDDSGYEAALKCLSRDLITADFDESKFITMKMQFIQHLMNENIKLDAQLDTQRKNDKIDLIDAADAKAKVIPVQTEFC